jgi:hypothetical protein
MAAIVMVQVQKAKNMGGKFPKIKVKLSTIFIKPLHLHGN